MAHSFTPSRSRRQSMPHARPASKYSTQRPVSPRPATARSHPPPRPSAHAPEKRLILTCDGTWLNTDNGIENGQLLNPSNVARIGWAIKDESSDGIPQLVYYQAGVGSEGGFVDRVAGGIAAVGIAENIREAYNFLANNYTIGDEIFLIGFSRGAFTARSVASLIGCIGLLTKRGLPYFSEIFKDFENRKDPKYEPRYPNLPFPNKPNIQNPRYTAELEKRGMTTLNIPIKAIGVFDTVGSLGIPRIGWLEKFRIQSPSRREYSFYDTVVHDCIENAFQALALDERRASFTPAIWEKPRGSKTNLKQVWFPGVHSNIGGGYPDQEIANITLAWMMTQLEPFLDFHGDYLFRQYDDNRKYYHQSGIKAKPWSFGKLYNSLTSVYLAGGMATRTPGSYHRVDPDTGKVASKSLRNTNEYIHSSVRSRTQLKGPGLEDRGDYESKALKDWRLVKDHEGDTVPQPLYLWRAPNRRKVIPESALKGSERILLEMDPDVEDCVMEYGGGPKKKSKSRRSSRVSKLSVKV
ncbi:MAG: hypothetical protein M1834_002858 [Cirrosporium novae-zelandiae]|nr:MAG: hypothetical protein M1834_002858 [Cirrosporium novae-zelandiae]